MVTIDTNIAIYAFTSDPKASIADAVLRRAQFASNQVAYEYANVMGRKFKLSSRDISPDLGLLQRTIPDWYAVELENIVSALDVGARYKLQFYDALMIATGLAHGATTLFSEDMQHGLVIEGKLRIENPFL